MGGKRVASALSVVAIVLLWSSPAAANEPRIDISPSTVAPGDSVTILSSCVHGSVSSEVFDESDLTTVSRGDEYNSGATPVVDDDASPGVYEVEVTCRNDAFVMDQLVVSDSGAQTGGGAMAGGVDGVTTGAGVLLLGAAAGGALLYVRRRRTSA